MTQAVFFPFDLFGSGGAGQGARLLAEAFEEMLEDNRREKKPTRARAYQDRVRMREVTFEKLADYAEWREMGRKIARASLRRRELLLWVTGNHLGALPVFDELATHAADTLVIQFDAHLDIYNLSDCTAEPSHGNFLLHAAGPLPTLVNVGHRELLLRPEYIARYYRHTFPAAQLAVDPEPALDAVRRLALQAGRVFLDIDCDVFDPAFFPAVSHPLPFGLTPQLLLRFLDAAWAGRLAGLALSEFDPARDRHDQSLATLVWLLEYLLLRYHEKR